SSLVAADGKILATTLDGRTYVFKAGRQFEVLASNQVGEPVWASLAIVNGTVFVRGGDHLFAFKAR
ncbi:MAG TPA: PQQ-binding-like beta-propeller repeat protein, partial [Acidobacteriota bacterium]|nr:PQQ-binding-like beta-propeller repeat protein [Acidobacteriota bacterium]